MNPIPQSFSPGYPVFTKIILITLFGVTAGHAIDRYVSPTGLNTNSGDISNPWKTINYGAAQLNAGDRLFVRGGIYSESVYITRSGASDTNPIIITNYPNESPIIDGAALPDSNWRTLLDLYGNYIHVSGFEVRNCNMQADNPYPQFPSGGYGVNLEGSHNRLSRMNVHHNRSTGILAGGNQSIVEDSFVWQNCQDNSGTPPWGCGLALARGGNSGTGFTYNAIARRNTVFNNFGEGINTFEADGTLIEDNVVYDNYSVNLYISDARNVLAQRNMVYVSSNSILPGSSSITLADEVASKPRSANNKVINNFIYGGRFEAFSWTIVPNSGLNNVLIANNTFVNSQLRTPGSAGSAVSHLNSAIRNNIFLSDSGVPALVNGTTNTANVTFSNNAWSHTPHSSLSALSDVTGNLLVARTGSTTAGNLSWGYFRLLPGSSAINKAMALPPYNDYDFFGIHRGASPDSGGHEGDDVPTPWLTQDVGAVGAPGNATSSSGTFTVTGSGINIWDTADEFRYVYQPSSADCSITARVTAVGNTDPYSKAGVMIRESNAAGARYAAVLVTPSNTISFRWRYGTGAISYQVALTGATLPQYVKLQRIGNAFTASYSSNGSAWTQIGTSQNIAMSSAATLGQAVVSNVDGQYSKATFDNVTAVP